MFYLPIDCRARWVHERVFVGWEGLDNERYITVEANPLELYTHLGTHIFQFVAHVDAEEGWHECHSEGYPLRANPCAQKTSLTIRFTLYVWAPTFDRWAGEDWQLLIARILPVKGMLPLIQLIQDTCLPSFPPLSVHLLMSLMLSKTISVTTYMLSNLQGRLDHIGDKGLVVMLKWWRPWSWPWPGPNHISLMEGLPIRVVWCCLQRSCQVDVVIARLTVNGSGVVVQLRYVIFTVCGMWR